jgi:hypothetical protein
MSRLIAFLTRHRCFVRKADAAPSPPKLTHLLMDGQFGGRLRVPDELLPDFYAAYGEDIEARLLPCVVELRSEVFRLHYDVDIKVTLSDAELLSVARVVHETSCLYFADRARLACVVCASYRDGRRAGSSLHLVLPDTAVDDACALWIRAGVVCACAERLEHLGLDFNEVIDSCVFRHSGFRMIGSDKCRSCPQCHGKREAAALCPDCNRQGKIMERRVYAPWTVLPECGHEELRFGVLHNLSYAAKRCAIRLPSGTPVSTAFAIPSAAPAPCRRRGRDRLEEAEPASPPQEWRLTIERLDAETLRLLAAEVRGFHPMYAGVDVREVRSASSARQGRRSYVVKISGPGSRYCSNKRGEHASNSAYFVVTPDGLAQRCFSRKPQERSEGLCGHYSSALRPLSDALREALFPPGEALALGQLGGGLFAEPEFVVKRPRL